MSGCPCGCGLPVKPRRRFAETKCFQRFRSQHQIASGGRAKLPRVTKSCQWCQAPFVCRETETERRRYCSQRCGALHHNRAPEFARLKERRIAASTRARQSEAYRSALSRAKSLSPADAYALGYRTGYRTAYEHGRAQVDFYKQRSQRAS